MATIKWGTPIVSLTDYLTTELNSLADGALESSGAEINNESNLAMYMDLELTLASVDLSAQSNPSVGIFMPESVDGGTTYHDEGTDATTTAALYPTEDCRIATMGVQVGTGAQAHYAVRTMIPIPPGRFKLVVLNNTGAALASSGNILAYRTYALTSA